MADFDPTPQQAAIRDFIQSEPEVNLMVEAVAGAAKTSTIEISAPGIGPELTPLAVSFNKKIAVELVDRLPPWFSVKTLNALGHRAWMTARGGTRINLDTDKMYKLVKASLPAEMRQGEDDSFAAVLALARGAKSIGLVPSGAPMGVRGIVEDTEDNWQEIAFQKGLDVGSAEILQARQAVLSSIKAAFSGEIDYDDQIYMSVLFGGVYPKHHTVIVDESQDLSPLNHIQLRKMTKTRLIAVGDPYQAIYAFRGADADSMSNLQREMGGGILGNVLHILESQRQEDIEDGVRGAFVPPVVHSLIGKGNFHKLELTNSFRVPHLIGRRQRNHVPHFDVMPWLPEGTFEVWPNRLATPPPETDDALVARPTWSINDIPSESFVLCRNNAPLMSLAFTFIKHRRPVKILGKDIGATLANLLLKVTGKEARPISDCYALLEDWKRKEIAKAGDAESKVDVIYDRFDSLFVMLEAVEDQTPKGTNLDTEQFIRNLFTDKPGETMTELSSGHRAKGLEKDWVMILDPFRCPSKWALKADKKGNPGPLLQERNLNYVMETRAKRTLVHANLDDCKEVGE